MAYISQEKKKQISAKLKVALKGSGLKYSLSIQNHSKLVMTIQSGPFDFFNDMPERFNTITGQYEKPRITGDRLSVNTYWLHEHFSGKSREVLMVIRNILNDGNHDNSDVMTDYFDVGWYIGIEIGRYGRPYTFVMGQAENA